MRPPSVCCRQCLRHAGLLRRSFGGRRAGAIAAAIILYGGTYPKRRQLKTSDPLPERRWRAIAVGSVAVVLGLLGNVAGVPFEPGVGPIAIAATWTLGCEALVFSSLSMHSGKVHLFECEDNSRTTCD